MTPGELLNAADKLLAGRSSSMERCWQRACAALLRVALEQALDEYWRRRAHNRGVPEEVYVFTLRTYDRLAKAAVNPAVGDRRAGAARRPRHIGVALQVAGRDRNGAWLGVSLIETEDDLYEAG